MMHEDMILEKPRMKPTDPQRCDTKITKENAMYTHTTPSTKKYISSITACGMPIAVRIHSTISVQILARNQNNGLNYRKIK